MDKLKESERWREIGKLIGEGLKVGLEKSEETKVRSENFLRADQLKDGKCVAVTKYNDKIIRFDATRVSQIDRVFFCIPWGYEILGYEQEDVDRA